jgi:hypothetical protein
MQSMEKIIEKNSKNIRDSLITISGSIYWIEHLYLLDYCRKKKYAS